MEWNRIFLDEAHYIKKHKRCLAMCGLKARFRWVFTKTPIPNMEVQAIFKFLKCSLFFHLQIGKPMDTNNENDQSIITMIKTLVPPSEDETSER